MSQGRVVHAARKEATQEDTKNWANSPVSFCPPPWPSFISLQREKHPHLHPRARRSLTQSWRQARHQDSMKNTRHRCGLGLGANMQVTGQPPPHACNKRQCNGADHHSGHSQSKSRNVVFGKPELLLGTVGQFHCMEAGSGFKILYVHIYFLLKYS